MTFTIADFGFFYTTDGVASDGLRSRRGAAGDKPVTPHIVSILKPPNARKSQRNAELLFEESRLAVQLAEIDLGLGSRDQPYENRLTLNLHVHAADDLRFSSIERYGYAQQRGQLPDALAIRLRNGTIKPMVRVGHRFAVIANKASHHGLLVFAKPGNVGVAHQIFAVFMVPPGIHRDAYVMQQGSQFECNPLR
jgi:hypothetical protein